MFTSQLIALGLLVAASLVSAHGKIASATGDLGGKGAGLGILAGAANLNSQGDVTIFQGGAFGKTNAVSLFISFLVYRITLTEHDRGAPSLLPRL